MEDPVISATGHSKSINEQGLAAIKENTFNITTKKIFSRIPLLYRVSCIFTLRIFGKS